VDDIVLTGSNPVLLNNIVAHLRAEFAVKDMGELRFFLGIDIKRTSAGFFLSQERYTDDILQRPCMTQCKPVSTPIDSKGKLSADGAAIEDPASYRSLAGALM
jgi:histone deacetylase 1/2